MSEYVIDQLRRPPHGRAAGRGLRVDQADEEDLHLALYCCYELHYRGFDGVDEGWEWNPGLLQFRSRLERAWLDQLFDEVGPPGPVADLKEALQGIVAGGTGPSLSGYMAKHGTLEQFREFAVHRSAYQLKEADPHTWAIPRLDGTAKAALVAIQTGEYGDGNPQAMHSVLFARTMECLGLDSSYGAYLPDIPGVTLATVNLVSFLGLHRKWRGALLGHLAVFEMCSVGPMGRYSQALSRLGLGPEATAFYDVHVEADAVHEVIALHDLAAGFGAAEPRRAGDLLFGARAVMSAEDHFARRLLDSWAKGTSSLYRPGGDPFANRALSGGHEGHRRLSGFSRSARRSRSVFLANRRGTAGVHRSPAPAVRNRDDGRPAGWKRS